MSSLYKFENKLIDYTDSDLVRNYLNVATNELTKIQRSFNFDPSMTIVKDRALIKVSLVANQFTLSIRHGEQEHKTTVKLLQNGSLVREMKLVDLYNPKLLDELKTFLV